MPILPLLFLLFVAQFSILAAGFGSMGPLAAAFGGNDDDQAFFCAIDAGGNQDVVCWGKNSSSEKGSAYFNQVPPMAGLSGGDGFLCGLLSNTSHAYCWSLAASDTGNSLVPDVFSNTGYSIVAAGKSHVCAVRGSYYSSNDWGTVDCWDIVSKVNNNSLRLSAVKSVSFYDQAISISVFSLVVSGDGFSCGGVREGGVVCWGPKSSSLGVDAEDKADYLSLASSSSSVCGIMRKSGEIKCWGDRNSFDSVPVGIRFVGLAAGANHFCGIREDDHGVECWGKFDSSAVPKGSGFMAIASSNYVNCGIREEDLVLDCWFADVSLSQGYEPPLQLCSPGLCSPVSCGAGTFEFNASKLNEPDLTSLCILRDLRMCSPCGFSCREDFFVSSACTANADRVCTPCSLCQSSSCSDVCKIKLKHQHQLYRLVLIVGSVGACFLLALIGFWGLLPHIIALRKVEASRKKFDPNADIEVDLLPHLAKAPSLGSAQVFRLAELKDATNGFKEFNELGRGRYGFVYKALLTDGRHVAVKRANAATIIHNNTRDFEMELDILCKLGHPNIVNLLGYCCEMGERLLVYELMPHGTLHDHLHGGLSPLNWSLRIKIATQAAKGLEYLHHEAVPPIVHRDVKSSNILLDSEWRARISDFGLHTPNDKDIDAGIKTDVYNFGIILLEILSGRKAYDIDYTPPSVVEWALPLIRQGKAAAIFDMYTTPLPRNVEPLLRLAEVAELALKEDPNQRPKMSELVMLLEHSPTDGSIL